MLTALSDAQAIAASLQDGEHFASVFDRHFGAIHRYLHRRMGRELADDLAAETFAQAFDGRADYDQSREDARPWLFGIAANLLRHHRRTERRRLFAYARAALSTDVGFDVEIVHRRVDADATKPFVALALATLDTREREPLLLLAWADLTYEEIAEALGVPPGTVRSRIHRARRRVRSVLEAHGPFALDPPDSNEEE